MQIYSVNNNIFIKKHNKNNQDKKIFSSNPINISFEARVDKGLARFYDANFSRMPLTLKNYIDKMPNKASQTPLQAQAAAFAALAGITTIAEIKSEFKEEDLFKELKEPSESKATRGILSVFRGNKDLLEMYDKSILKSKENLTVWLVKKIFLEGKTIDEINIDFNEEADNDFKALYEKKEGANNPIKSGTLKALGIKLPDFEFLQSIRYTRDGYSDSVGEKISQTLSDFYASLPIEERTARARKSIENFENWWNSMTRDQQLDLIAEQKDELELLKLYNESPIGKKTKPQKSIKRNEQTLNKQSGINVESKLSRDDLFRIWATNNLKIFEAGLTDYDRAKIQTKRETRQAERWNSMSAEEKTEYINRIRRSTEPLKYAMIDAWNNNQDIIIELSHFLTKRHFNKPEEILYGSKEFNKFFAESMTIFWETHPQYAEKLGEAIRISHDKIKTAINNGRFEVMKRDINKLQVKREQEVHNAVKNYREVLPEEVYSSYPKYMQEFIDSYSASENVNINLLPTNYIQEYFRIIAKEFRPELILSWTKQLDKLPLSEEDLVNLEKIKNFKSENLTSLSRTIEAVLATILYDCTNNPEVYLLSDEDCKFALKQIEEGKKEINLYSNNLNKEIKIPIINNQIKIKEIDSLYDSYNIDINMNIINSFIEQYVTCDLEQINKLKIEDEISDYIRSYINSYKLSSMIICDKSHEFSPEIREKFAEKFIKNIDSKYSKLFTLKTITAKDFKKEDNIDKQINQVYKKYKFLPKNMVDIYTYELSKIMRDTNQKQYEFYKEKCCTPLKSPNDSQTAVFFSRHRFRELHALFTLAIEQALCDILYEISGNDEVYALRMEELFPIFENLNLRRKDTRLSLKIHSSTLDKDIELSIKRHFQPYHIENKYKEYYNEFQDLINELSEEKTKTTKEDILYILNPDETKTRVDELTRLRINNSLYSGMLIDK